MPRKKQRNRGPRQERPQTRGDEYHKHGYKELVKKNELFEKYYRDLGIIPEEEFDQFLECMRSPLPSTFRITGYKSQSKQLLKMMKHEFFSTFDQVEVDGEKLKPPTSLPWYPDELAWKIDLARSVIRKNDILKSLHKFLVAETESGNISRQEAVSMIPPLVMDVKPHHKILDMCAAPGSKTSQLIEYLHSDENTPVPEGFVVANDADNKRCYLMVHQVKRLQSPNFMIVNHDASRLPNMFLTPKGFPEKKTLCYDRVLADVPCSGDGTMRKNPDIWKKWTPKNGQNLHGLQKRILKRGVEVLEVGGRLVYSTCSLNPVEDEAVIASMLDQCEGAIELIDVSSELPGLKFIPGIKTWKVMARNAEWYNSWSDIPEDKQEFFAETMFPPTPEKCQNFNLDRCMRILPHAQDTGGFFVAVVQKVQQVPWLKKQAEQLLTKSEDTTESNDPATSQPDVEEVAQNNGVKVEDGPNEESKTNEDDASLEPGADSGEAAKRKAEPIESGQPPKKKRMFGFKEDPFIFYKEDDPTWPMIRDFYKIKEDFPNTQLMVRCETGKKRNIYFLSSQLKNLALYNEDRVKFINMGVKVLSRSPSPIVPCDFRLAQDGVNAIHMYLNGRKLFVGKEDLITLLSTENPWFSRMSQETQKAMDVIGPGAAIFVLQFREEGCEPFDVIVCGWIGKASCRSFVAKSERIHFLTMLGVPTAMHGDTDPIKQKEQSATDEADQEDKGELKDNMDEDDGNVADGDGLDGDKGSSAKDTLKEDEAQSNVT